MNDKNHKIIAFEKWYAQEWPIFRSLYTYFHEHPELAFQEKKTAAKLAELLADFGYQITHSVGKTGVVAVMKNGDGPCIMYRSEMDGLPISEKTEAPFASRETGLDSRGVQTGVMHACGHDVHLTIMLALARFFSIHRDTWSGTLVFIGQPAEEIGTGARAMIADGLFERFPKPDYLLAVHLLPSLASDELSIKSGTVLASVRNLKITFLGKMAHAGDADQAVDPIILMSKAVLRFHEIVKKENTKEIPIVLNIGSAHSGTAFNVIPDRAYLDMSLRSFSDKLMTGLIAKIRRIAQEIALEAGLEKEDFPEVVVSTDIRTDVTINDSTLSARLEGFIQEVIPADKVKETPFLLVGDDIAYYPQALDTLKMCLVFLGATEKSKLEEAEKQGGKVPFLLDTDFLPDFEGTFHTGLLSMFYCITQIANKD